MFENIYTTKMSAGKKNLQARFANIRGGRGKISKFAAIALTAVLTAAALCGAAVMAAVDTATANTVSVFYNGAEQNLKNQPFIYDSEVYLPLRELMNICGVDNGNISYDNGIVKVRFASDAKIPVEAEIGINRSGIRFDKDYEYNIMEISDRDSRSTTHPAIVVNDTTFIPSGMVLKIKNYYIAEKYDDRVYLNLLGNLEVRRYGADGKYDAVISAPTDMNKADKDNPKSYCGENERVVIGTAADFDNEEFAHTEINGYYYPTDAKKHILVDDEGKVIAVIPYESFKHESVDPQTGGTSSWETAVSYAENEDGLMLRRGGINVFVNEKRTSADGTNYNYAMPYCFVDFRYFVK